jgi:hypothetical protein
MYPHYFLQFDYVFCRLVNELQGIHKKNIFLSLFSFVFLISFSNHYTDVSLSPSQPEYPMLNILN